MNLRAAGILGILALAFSSAALAQTQPVQGGVESSVTGTVVSASGSSLVIRSDGGAGQTFDVDTSSAIPAGLMPGNRVTVRYHVLDTGRRHAASVVLGDAVESAPVTTPTTPDPAPAPEPITAAGRNAGDRLPETASELPLLALAGVMAIAAGLVLRELRRRDA